MLFASDSFLKGKIKEAWGKLTDDEVQMVEGKRDQLIGVIQKKYGMAKDEVERQLDEHARKCGC